jgi:hypothetical protein
MKLKFLVITILIFFSISLFGQAPAWEWVKRSYGAKISHKVDGDGNEAYSMAADVWGNVYVTGYFLSPTIIFDNDTLFNSSENNDIFLVKYDKNGDVVWARSLGGNGDDEPCSVAADIHGNVYIAGFFKSPIIIFGNDTIVNISRYSNVLLCKFDSSGKALWAKTSKGNSNDKANSVVVDNSGNIYMTGYFQSSIIIFGSDTITNKGSLNIFITKYNSNGNIIWAKSYGGSFQDNANSITVDAKGNVFVGGAFKSPYIVFGSDTLYNNSNSYYSGLFLTKFDSNGKVLWAKSASDYSDERIYNLATDLSGNIYATGVFYSLSFKLDTITLANTSVISDNFFIAKFNSNGHALWVKNGGSNGNNKPSLIAIPSSVATDASGNAIVTINYNSGSIGIGADSLHNAGLYDGAVAKFDRNGNLLWTKDIGGSKDDGACAVTVNSFQNIFVTGFYQSPSVLFPPYSLTSQDTHFSTVFVAKLLMR